MRPEDRDAAYLWDMIQAAKDVAAIAERATYETFLSDRIMQLACERAIQNIGEAARRLSPTVKQAHPEIPWASIIGQRNVIVHQYEDIDYDMIWNVATVHASVLIRELTPLLPPVDDEEPT
jgi:uncharacterized protein with HEPN domain